MNKRDIKNILIILGICIIATIAGFFFGRGFRRLEESGVDLNPLLGKDTQQIMTILAIVYAALSVVAFAITYLYIGVCRTAAHSWNGEDEDAIRILEHRLNVPMISSSIMMIFNMLFMPMCFMYADIGPNLDKSYAAKITVLFFVNYIWIITSNEIVVRMEKKLNPEKRGSVLELNFQKKWESGLDEAEKLIMYKAAYKTMKITNWTCLGLWLVSFICMEIWDAGILPLVMVCAIWFVLTMTNMIETMRLER